MKILIGICSSNLKKAVEPEDTKRALVKEQCRLDTRKYSFSQRVINEWNKLPNDCVNASSVNMFKNRIDRYLHVDEKIVGLSISQWLPCPLAIWYLLFGMAILFRCKYYISYKTRYLIMHDWSSISRHSQKVLDSLIIYLRLFKQHGNMI